MFNLNVECFILLFIYILIILNKCFNYCSVVNISTVNHLTHMSSINNCQFDTHSLHENLLNCSLYADSVSLIQYKHYLVFFFIYCHSSAYLFLSLLQLFYLYSFFSLSVLSLSFSSSLLFIFSWLTVIFFTAFSSLTFIKMHSSSSLLFHLWMQPSTFFKTAWLITCDKATTLWFHTVSSSE